MDELTADKNASPVLTEIPRHAPAAAASTTELAASSNIASINLALLLLTMLTTTMAGAYMAGAERLYNPALDHPLLALIANLAMGLSFSLPLMAILLSHEMGHYLTARRNRVDTSLPYFIPAPFPSVFMIGTFGAFIRIRQRPPSRRAIFDIGAAGPWAGFALAVPAVIVGLKLSQTLPLDTSGGGLELGNSLIFWGLARWVLGVDPDSVNVNLHPVAFAGWLGLFVTALNLLPVGQLDGGHVIYALFGGRRHRAISRVFVLGGLITVMASIFLGLSIWGGWILWGVLLVALGLGHPSTVDPVTPLDPPRRLAAWLTIALFVITFSPVPFQFKPPRSPHERTYEVHFVTPAPRSVSPAWLHRSHVAVRRS